MPAYSEVFPKSLRRKSRAREPPSAGEGTELGFSLSHDIVVEQHNGTLEVATKPSEYTQFTNLISGHRRDLTLLAKLTAGRQIRATQVVEAAATCIQVFDLRHKGADSCQTSPA